MQLMRSVVSRQHMLHSKAMSQGKPLSYSAALGNNVNSSNIKSPQPSSPNHNTQTSQPLIRKRRSPSPSYVPQTASEEENVYVLTLLTDKAHHDRMTDLRTRYFPRKINKLAAHLTLFHALPESRLETNIIPTLKDVVSKTAPFRVHADKPFRMKKGIAVSVAESTGGREGKQVHRALQDAWRPQGFLSDQDAGGMRMHYTLMNKVDDAREVDAALQDLMSYWSGDTGTAEGLALWRYDRGFWRWDRKFTFDAEPER